MPRLAGRQAFIPGAGNGIGRATAIQFAREGARVAIAEIDAPAGEETTHLAGNETIAIRADVTAVFPLHIGSTQRTPEARRLTAEDIGMGCKSCRSSDG
jgi:NAD(P)-dependent dehydrogenase (short-subunit alcohol dehydrogenase family)